MYLLTEIGYDSSRETAETLVDIANEHCSSYEDRQEYFPITTVAEAIKYFNTFGFQVVEV